MTAAYVQSASAFGAPSTALTATLPSAVADHETIVVGVANWSALPTSVVDNYGNTYTLIDQANGANGSCATYYAKNVTGSGGVANFAVTANFAAAQFAWIAVHDVSGCDRTAPLDQHTLTTGSGGSPAAGPVTTTQGGEYIFGIFNGAVGSAFSGPGAGFTQRETQSGGLLLSEDQVQGAAGAISATFTATAGVWIAGIATFLAAASSTNAILLGTNP